MNYEYRLYQYRDGVLTLQKRSAQWNDENTWDGWEDVDTVFEAQEEANEQFRKSEGIVERQAVTYVNGVKA
jgi:hypothetical protein